MSEQRDRTLVALGEIERDYERRHPDRWEAVLAGEAPAAQVAAERVEIDPPDEHAVFQDMFSGPASEAEIAALVGRAEEVLRGAAPASEAGRRAEAGVGRAAAAGPREEAGAGAGQREEAGAGAAGLAGGGAAGRGAEVVSLASRRRGPAVVAAALAIAAAVLLWRFTAAPAFVPGSYTLTLRDAAVSELRSSDAAPERRRYTRSSELDWALSPERASAATLELRALATAPDGRATLVTPVFTRTPAGALRIRGRVGEVLPLPVGTWRLVFVVAPAGAAPTSAEEAGRAATIGRPVELEIAE